MVWVGAAFTDSSVDAKFTEGGLDYDIGNADTDNKFALIGGCDLVTPQNVAINIEARITSEVSLSGGATVKF